MIRPSGREPSDPAGAAKRAADPRLSRIPRLGAICLRRTGEPRPGRPTTARIEAPTPRAWIAMRGSEDGIPGGGK